MITVGLPHTVSGYDKVLAKWKGMNRKNLPLDVRKIVEYSGTALQIGRPLNKVMIVLVGECASGKSALIKEIFHDGYPDTTVCDPKTKSITEYVKELCVDDESSKIKGKLSFVDIPGFLSIDRIHTNKQTDSIVKFREENEDISKRKPEHETRTRVYPNLVLFTVQASLTLMHNQNGKLLVNLKLLERCGIVDEHKVNIIVVVTHASSLGTNWEMYNSNRRKICRTISQAVYDIFKVSDVKIAFVENKTISFQNQKSRNVVSVSNLYISNYMLLKKVVEQFEKNNDKLGILFWEWYFDGSERIIEPTILHHNNIPVINLPPSLRSFYSTVSASRKANYLPTDLRKVISYVYAALKTGRPLNKVMIVMAGQTGAGKSETINVLFNEKLCATSTNTSETREVKEYGKELCVNAESPPLKGVLSFVDVPGSHDVEQSKEALNQASVRKFKEKNADLACRKGSFNKVYPVRQEVYPNAILLIVRATDNRMVGADSNFQQSLKLLQASGFVDPVYVNLIVVITHAMSIPCKKYSQTCREKQDVIQTALFNVLNIRNVPIVFVENCAADHNAEVGTGGDFYRLPDGQLSHYNLIQEMITLFKRNNDLLGRLFCGWYFASDCPEKTKTASVIKCIAHETLNDLNDKEVEVAVETLNQVKLGFQLPDPESTSLQFQYLGRGYCPRTETTKSANMCPGKERKLECIGKKNYSIPRDVLVVPKNEVSFQRRSQATKKDYEASRVKGYGIETDIKLIVNVASKGRWAKDDASNDTESELSTIYEVRLASLTLDEPEFETKVKLLRAIGHLPTYSKENAEPFKEFFRKWGSHFICEEYFGGCIKFEASVKVSTYTEKLDVETFNRFKFAIKGYWLPGSLSGEYNNSGLTSRHQHKYEEQIRACGGDPPLLRNLDDLTPELVLTWRKSVRIEPMELTDSFKLKPYYSLVSGQQRTNLKNATLDYLQGALTDTKKVRRNEVSRIITDDVKQEVSVNAASCFPPSANVYTKNGLLPISAFKCGDEVITLCNKTSETCTTEICTYLHFDPDVTTEFLVFLLRNGKSLAVTGGHLLFCYDNGNMRPICANKIRIGIKLAYVTTVDNSMIKSVEPVNVVAISKTTMQGVFSPLTLDGTFIVDGVFVSCYAHVDSHAIAHACMAPLRWWYSARKFLKFVFRKNADVLEAPSSSSFLQNHFCILGIHTYAKCLMLLDHGLPLNFYNCKHALTSNPL